MRNPQSPRGWFCWGVSVSDRYQFPHSVKYQYEGRTDPRVDDRREASISVKMLAEKASHTVCGNGIGYKLLIAYYVEEVGWFSFTPNEQWIIEKTIRAFRRELVRTGFLPPDR